MSRTKKPHRTEVFRSNMEDADQLLALAAGLHNNRTRRTRKELRSRVGDALRIPVKSQDLIECVESDDVFVVIKPGSSLVRSNFSDHGPMMRQALVVGCAATETYLNDLVMDHLANVTDLSSPTTTKIKDVPMTVGQWLTIERAYKRRRRGLREVVLKDFVAVHSSTSPTRVGGLMSLLGISDWSKKVDNERNVEKGATVGMLESVTARRNRIAHAADRVGQRQAQVRLDEVASGLEGLASVVNALEVVVTRHFA